MSIRCRLLGHKWYVYPKENGGEIAICKLCGEEVWESHPPE